MAPPILSAQSSSDHLGSLSNCTRRGREILHGILASSPALEAGCGRGGLQERRGPCPDGTRKAIRSTGLAG